MGHSDEKFTQRGSKGREPLAPNTFQIAEKVEQMHELYATTCRGRFIAPIADLSRPSPIYRLCQRADKSAMHPAWGAGNR